MASVPSVYPILRNSRLYAEQRVQSRAGMVKITAVPFDQSIVHSIRRLNDKTVPTFDRIVGAGTKLYLASNPAAIDTGYSGNPLSLVPFRPDQSPRSWMYVGDANKMRKVLVDGTNYQMGIAPPIPPPLIEFGPPAVNVISRMDAIGSWTVGGTAGALSTTTRYSNSSQAVALLENPDGSLNNIGTATAPAWGSIILNALSFLHTGSQNVNPGMVLALSNNVTTEYVVVQKVLPQVWPLTTVLSCSIKFDSGNGGPCTVVVSIPPTLVDANLGFTPSMDSGSKAQGIAPRLATNSAVGLQVDSVVGLGPYLVRVMSVSRGVGGTVSFRAILPAGAGSLLGPNPPILSTDSVRVYIHNNNYGAYGGASNAIVSAVALQSTIGAGIGTIQEVTPLDLGTFGANDLPVQEDDVIHLSFQIDNAANLTELRLLFDVDATTNDFKHTYYFKSWAASDIQQALQGDTTIQQGRSSSYSGAVVNQNIGNISPLARRVGPVVFLRRDDPANTTLQKGSNYPTSSKASPAGLAGWLELTCKVSDLTKVGTDSTASLSNVKGVQIQVTVSSQATCAFHSLWIGGAYGPDVGTIGAPYLYRFRYRSSATGAVSLASPATRSGLEPHRQSVLVYSTPSSDPQVDLIDIFRWGGTLPQWTYVGSCGNFSGVYLDVLDDTTIANAPLLDTDKFQPFPTVDTPKAGMCNVTGTTVTWVSGDQFNPRWYPGGEIVINGIVYNLYAQPPSVTQLEIVQNGGTQSNVPFQINQATLLGQPLPAFWGPYAQGTGLICFACGDSFQPGVLFLTNPNDPDSASDVLQIEITTPSEPLMNGCMYNGNSYVWSSDRFFSLYPSFGSGYVIESGTLLPAEGTNLFVALEVPNGKGLFGRYNLAVGSAIFSRARDGIYKSTGGAPQSITQGQLSLLFPHDNEPGQPVTVGTFTIYPPDDALPNLQRLSYSNSFLYFDYQDVQGNKTTLVWSEVTGAWTKDDYTPTVCIHYGEEGENVNSMLLGGSDGNVWQASGDNDGDGNPFPFEARMPQLSELVGGYGQWRDGFVGLMNSAGAKLVLNVDGADKLVALADTAVYKRTYMVLPSLKGKLNAMGLLGVSPFLGIFQRDCEFRFKTWGDQQYTKINPFGSFSRAASPKVT